MDRLALSSGISEFAMERVSAAIVYCLQEMSQKGGHCFSDSETLLKEVTLLIIGKPEFLSAKAIMYSTQYAQTKTQMQLILS